MPERLRLLTVLAAFIGLREGELWELRRPDIHGVTGRINLTRKVDKNVIPATKGACPECGRVISAPKTASRVRTVHVPPPFLPMLQKHLLEHGATAAELQARACHASRAAMAIYQHATFDRDKSLAEAIGTPTLRGRRIGQSDGVRWQPRECELQSTSTEVVKTNVFDKWLEGLKGRRAANRMQIRLGRLPDISRRHCFLP